MCHTNVDDSDVQNEKKSALIFGLDFYAVSIMQ